MIQWKLLKSIMNQDSFMSIFPCFLLETHAYIAGANFIIKKFFHDSWHAQNYGQKAFIVGIYIISKRTMKIIEQFPWTPFFFFNVKLILNIY